MDELTQPYYHVPPIWWLFFLGEHMSEADEQIAVVDYCEFKGYPIYHIPNGGLRRKSEAARLKAQGVRPGVPDLCIPMARGAYHGLYIEMKSKHGRPTPKQKEWISRLRDEGFCAYVCIGASSAIALIDLYMQLGDKQCLRN